MGIAIIWGSITVSGRTLLRDRVMGTIEQMEGSCAPMHLKTENVNDLSAYRFDKE